MPDQAVLVAERYELRELVGRGGMAVVHRGWDRRLDRPVAVKVFPVDAGSPAEASRRQSETQLLASLHHPSLVTLFDALATEQATCLVMELVDGPTVADVLRQQGRLEVPRPCEVDRDVPRPHAQGELAVSPEHDDREQPLTQPHERAGVGRVVARGAAGLLDDGEQHGDPQEPEHGVREQAGEARRKVDGVAPEARPDQVEVGPEHVCPR
jgi:hypothetical protein